MAVLRLAETNAGYVKTLAKAGKHDDARKLGKQVVKWIEHHLTTPLSRKSVAARAMDPATRRALYHMALARGEVELAAGAYKASADSFGEAVKLYDGHVEDETDMSRMIRAHFNQANSLLRIGRIDEALDIYELAEMGFGSIGDQAAAARVQDAKNFARQNREEILQQAKSAGVKRRHSPKKKRA